MVTQLPFGQEKMHQMTLSPIRFIRCIDPNDAQPLKYFNGQTAHGLAGIGNPSRFFRALRDQMGVKVIRHPMPDHHVYTLDDIVFDDTLPVLMTEKDAVKIKDLADQRHWYLEVSATLPDNFIFQLGERLKQLKEQKG
jgi:tetraacyldisaccharide 4'-kinase